MLYFYLASFIIFTAIHLYASFQKNVPLRDFSKGFILYSLMAFYAEAVPEPSWVVIGALFMSWIGDILLIPKGVKWFSAGGISFMVSHFLFILAYLKDITFGDIPLYATILLGIFFATAVAIIFSKLKVHLPNGLFYPMFIYLLINGAMNCFAIFRLITEIRLGTILTAVGALLFFASDSSLFFVRFDKNSILKTHFFVMLTYSIGEFLILLGLTL